MAYSEGLMIKEACFDILSRRQFQKHVKAKIYNVLMLSIYLCAKGLRYNILGKFNTLKCYYLAGQFTSNNKQQEYCQNFRLMGRRCGGRLGLSGIQGQCPGGETWG